jgi:hypothetical protein
MAIEGERVVLLWSNCQDVARQKTRVSDKEVFIDKSKCERERGKG